MAKFKKGHIVPEEWRKITSKIHSGKHYSTATEFKKGVIPWIKGRHHTKKSVLLMRKTHLGIPIPELQKEKISKSLIGIKRSEEFKKKHSEIAKKLFKEGKLGQKGDLHWNWKGGISSKNRRLRTNSKWKAWRELIFKRDAFLCQNPNCKYCHNKIGVFLHPHHIKLLAFYPELAFDINNGITYCKDFHLKSKELHRFSNQLNIKNGGK